MTLPQAQSEFERRIADGQKLVHSLAAQIRAKLPSQVDLEEVVSYGQVGLAEAASAFDPSRGILFSTYAYYRIRGAIYDGVGKMAGLRRRDGQHVRRRRLSDDVLESESLGEGGGASTGDLAHEGRWLGGVVERLAVVRLTTLAAAEDLGDDELVCDDRSESPLEAAALRELVERLRGLIAELSEAERDLIRRVYFEGQTLVEVATAYGKNKSWSTRLHQRVLERLAQRLRLMGAD